MKMLYKRHDEFIEYTLSPDPAEALYWSTYRLKKGEIFLKVKLDRSITAEIRQEILDDILSLEPNPSKKSSAPADKIPKKRKTPKPQHAKAGEAKQKAG